MKRIVGFITALACVCPWGLPVNAAIDFGSKHAGFVIHEGAFNIGDAVLTDGLIRLVGNDTTYGSLAGETVDFNGMTVENEVNTSHSAIIVDGLYNLDTHALELASGDRLIVAGGTVQNAVSISGDVAFISGAGRFASNIIIKHESQLVMDWASTLNVNILADTAADATLSLVNDLRLAPGKIIQGVSGHPLVINFNDNILTLGGTNTTLAHHYTMDEAVVMLSGALTLDTGSCMVFTSDAQIHGGGNALVFTTGQQVNNSGHDVYLYDVVLSAYNESFIGSGNWHFQNVSLSEGGNSIALNGIVSGDETTPRTFFENNIQFSATDISLNKHCDLYGTWELENFCTINGNNHVLSLVDGVLALYGNVRLNDVVLGDIVDGSITLSDPWNIYVSNVTWLMQESLYAMRTTALPNFANGGVVGLSGADLFVNDTSFAGVQIELLTDAELSAGAAWLFTEDCGIDGGGKTLNLNQGSLKVDADSIVFLNNIILDGVVNDSLITGSGTFILSNVTIKLADTVTWLGKTPVDGTRIIVNGPVTVVTGNHILTVPVGSVVDGVTLLYDTLGATDRANVRGFDFENNGRCIVVDKPIVGNIEITDGGRSYLTRAEFLDFPNRLITFENDTQNIILDGLGRSLICPQTTDHIFDVAADTHVAFHNVLVDGFNPAQFDINTTIDHEGSISFGNGTVLRLQQDLFLTQTITFGSESGEVNEYMVFDLNRYTIDMSDANAEIILQGSNNTLRFTNGRITRLSLSKLAALSSNHIILENVELELSDDYAFGNARLQIEGNCKISGTPEAVFSFSSDADLLITQGATLTIGDGVVYYHDTAETENIVFADRSSCLALIGSTFRCANIPSGSPVQLITGTLVVDHNVTIDVSTIGMNWSDNAGNNNLSVEILPGALISVQGTGTLLYEVIAD